MNTLRIEAECFEFNNLTPNPMHANTTVLKHKVPTLVVNNSTYQLIKNVIISYNSKYNLIVELDREGKLYSFNKLKNIQSFDIVHGFEFVMTKNRSKAELINEISTLHSTVSGLNTKFRLGINVSFGHEHIKNCIDAITHFKSSAVNIDLIKIIHDKENDLFYDMVKSIRTSIGKSSVKVKIPSSGTFYNDTNLFYSMNIGMIQDLKKKELEAGQAKPTQQNG